jgi:predicted NAD/FAD-binding protein
VYEPSRLDNTHTRRFQPKRRGAREDRQKIAVVGTGISGLSAAWLLDKDHDVTVYEKNHYVGGHSNTADIEVGGREIAVDTGFIVYNPLNYPNLVALFEHLDVPTKPSDMSFGASLDDGALEYSGTDLNGLFSQRRNILRPRFLRMLSDLFRFYREAPGLVDDRSLQNISLGDFLRHKGYSDAFVYDHLMPMGAAIWSSSIEEMLSFPALTFVRFFRNHGLLKLTDRPEWRTVDGGSREYVRRLTADFSDQIRRADPVTHVERNHGQVIISTASGSRTKFDHVVMACHSDEALKLVTHPTDAERDILGQIHYQPNQAILHTDTALMPKRRSAWASWNYIGAKADDPTTNCGDRALCVTYWMNLLQGLQTSEPVLITLNPNRDIDPKKILRTYDYDHPIFDLAAMRAQPKLWELQGHQNTWYCGAYFGSGFHEDGIQAGLAVAEMLGGRLRPWQLEDPSSRVGISTTGPRMQVKSELAA